MPALLILGGNHSANQSTFAAADLFGFTPGTGNRLTAITTNIQ